MGNIVKAVMHARPAGTTEGTGKDKDTFVLPIASAGNIEYRMSWTGVADARTAGEVLDPWEAVELLEEALHAGRRPRFVEIAGPGEPLISESVFAALHLIRSRHPDLPLRVSTNGLALSDRLADLVRCGVRDLAVEIHALSPRTAERIYASATVRGRRLTGMAAAEAVVRSQWQAVMNAIECGMSVEVRMTVLPGINEGEIERMAQWAGMFGAELVTRPQ